MFIATAYAQQPATTPTAQPGGTASGLIQFAPMILIFFVFYFLFIRPQQKQQRLHKQMIADTKRGDEIITSSGIFGRVTEVHDDHVKVQIDSDVTIKLDKSHIQSIKGFGEKKAEK